LAPATAGALAHAVRAAADRCRPSRESRAAYARVTSRLDDRLSAFADATCAAPETVISWLTEGDGAFSMAASEGGRWVLRAQDPACGRSVEVRLAEGEGMTARSRLGGSIANLSARCRVASVIWMGRANAWLRLARLGLDDERAAEVRAECPPAGLSRSLCAKLVEATHAAAAQFQAEASALRNEAIADAYLDTIATCNAQTTKGGLTHGEHSARKGDGSHRACRADG
jgi:hypothetical protein